MSKVLIITDSHSLSLIECISKNILNKPWKTTDTVIETKYHLNEGDLNQHRVAILGLMGNTGYNFVNHLELIKDKSYDDYKVVLFMGFNDIVKVKENNNLKESVSKYINSAIDRFKRNEIVFITPLKNFKEIEIDEKTVEIHYEYSAYLKELCKTKDLECHDIYSLIGQTSIQDLKDEYHIESSRLFPLFFMLGLT